jgi:hypothetical protein
MVMGQHFPEADALIAQGRLQRRKFGGIRTPPEYFEGIVRHRKQL